MDYYVGVEADNFAVSKHRKSLRRFPSPDNCLQRGVATSEHFASINENCISATNVTSKELNEKGMPDEVDVENSIPGESSTDSSWCEEFLFIECSQMNPEASRDGTRNLGNQPDYEFDGIGEIDQTDDIFLRSLLEEDLPGMENPYRSVSKHPASDCSTMPSENLLTDMIADSQDISVNASTTNSLKNLTSNTHCFPSSADWDRAGNNSNFIPANLERQEDCSNIKESVVPRLIPAELNSTYKAERHLIAASSLEESVLQELELAMAQVKLTKSTRLCFRDSLYRLAKSSELPHVESQTQSGEITMEKHSFSSFHHKPSRFQGMDATDHQTNTIDRTIEKLMFDKLDCGSPEHSSLPSENLSKENVMMDGSPSSRCNWTPSSPYPRCSLLPQDADMSIFGGENMTIDFY